jgi:hypothetical protein
METAATFVLGFASGWVSRAIFDSWRGPIISATVALFAIAEGARRYAGLEREYFEDLFAEARVKWEAERSRSAARAAAAAAKRDSLS